MTSDVVQQLLLLQSMYRVAAVYSHSMSTIPWVADCTRQFFLDLHHLLPHAVEWLTGYFRFRGKCCRTQSTNQWVCFSFLLNAPRLAVGPNTCGFTSQPQVVAVVACSVLEPLGHCHTQNSSCLSTAKGAVRCCTTCFSEMVRHIAVLGAETIDGWYMSV